MALSDYLRRGWRFLSTLLQPSAEPEEEEKEEKPVEEAVMGEEAPLDEEAMEGALAGGQMVTYAKLPAYKQTVTGRFVRYKSKTEDIYGAKELETHIELNIWVYAPGQSPVEYKDKLFVPGVFIGDIGSVLQEQLELPAETWVSTDSPKGWGGFTSEGYIVVTVVDVKNRHIIMQKRQTYHRKIAS